MAHSRPLQAHLEPQPVNLDGRRQVRRALRLETKGSPGGSGGDGVEANVTVHNLSTAGLLLETELPLSVGDMLAVGLPDIGPVGVEIVWASGHLYGGAFEQALGEAALAAAQLRGEPQIGAPAAARRERPPLPVSGLTDPLGVTLNRLRRARGMTLEQVAVELGVSKPTVWAWEKGKARPLPERIGAIAAVLGVSEDELAESTTQADEAMVVEDCRQRIAAAHRTAPENIRIMIEL